MGELLKNALLGWQAYITPGKLPGAAGCGASLLLADRKEARTESPCLLYGGNGVCLCFPGNGSPFDGVSDEIL